MKTVVFAILIALTFVSAAAIAQTDIQPDTHIYKSVGKANLELDVYMPEGHSVNSSKPAVVFFFGGGWRGGDRSQFAPHAAYLASRGIIGITVTYRTKNSHGVTPYECVIDARSAVRWVRSNAAILGVDPARIAVSGGSAGGHLALCTTLLDSPDEDGEDLSVSCKGNAMILFNPVTNTASITARFGEHAKPLSPQHHITGELPPGILFHGKSDTTVAYKMVEQFTASMKEAGNDLTLFGYEGQKHGFFNKRNNNGYYEKTVAEVDAFLVKLGYLPPKSK